jgi:hypothetical protein
MAAKIKRFAVLTILDGLLSIGWTPVFTNHTNLAKSHSKTLSRRLKLANYNFHSLWGDSQTLYTIVYLTMPYKILKITGCYKCTTFWHLDSYHQDISLAHHNRLTVLLQPNSISNLVKIQRYFLSYRLRTSFSHSSSDCSSITY